MDSGLMIVALLVAFGNGANDNFKGFATVWGSNTLSYPRALQLATVATVAGSLVSVYLATALVQSFSGKGLVSAEIVHTSSFMFEVAAGAGATVLLATRLGFPVSTTHALIGGLIGAGLGQPGGGVNWGPLLHTFLYPLLLSPIVAAAISLVLQLGIKWRSPENDCACVVVSEPATGLLTNGSLVQQRSMSSVELMVAPQVVCEQIGPQILFSSSRFFDHLHALSAMSICFARAVNDTPKLAALLLVTPGTGAQSAVMMVTGMMATGGLLFAKKVAVTMSQRMTRLDPVPGLMANMTTAMIVLFASNFGFPVSTTHVAVGSIAGIGAGAQSLDRKVLQGILLSWVATLPMAGAIAFLLARF
ncbi:inorganic phosphate transporter [Ferrovum sp.]|uniref:inorganic phosphate transporter n=1 Tax=Ferrovum sp. TaxID=2609467 RepID=UPI00261ECC6B|nr:inorganic phosphate transporter [Ferrovum sp.]